MRKHTTALGLGAWFPRKILKFIGYEIASETIWANTMLLGGQKTEFHMYEYLAFLPIASYSTGFDFPFVRLSHKPHPSQMRLARLIVRLEERKVVRGLGRVLSHCSQPSHKF